MLLLDVHLEGDGPLQGRDLVHLRIAEPEEEVQLLTANMDSAPSVSIHVVVPLLVLEPHPTSTPTLCSPRCGCAHSWTAKIQGPQGRFSLRSESLSQGCLLHICVQLGILL